MEFGINSGAIPAVIMGLLLFGIGYNAFVSYAEKEGYTEGYMSIVVAGGVLATLGGIAIVSWQAALLCLAGFAASGVPMIIGSMIRFAVQNKNSKQAIIESVEEVIK